MKRPPKRIRADQAALMTHIVCVFWNTHICTWDGYHPGGKYEVSEPDLADMLDMSRDAVHRALALLVDCELMNRLSVSVDDPIIWDRRSDVQKLKTVGNPTYAYHVTKQQLIETAFLLWANRAELIIFQDAGWLAHWGKVRDLQPLIWEGTITMNCDLPTFGRSDRNFPFDDGYCKFDLSKPRG